MVPAESLISGPETVTLTRDPAAIDRLQARLARSLEHLGYSKAARFAMHLAVHEALANALTHGSRTLPAEASISVSCEVTPEWVRVAVEDQGPGFRPEDIPDPTLDANLETPAGRGIMLIRAYMSAVRFSPRGNRIEMTYLRSPPTA